MFMVLVGGGGGSFRLSAMFKVMGEVRGISNA